MIPVRVLGWCSCCHNARIILERCLRGAIVRCGFECNEVIVATLIDMYGRSSEPSDCSQLFDEMLEPNCICYTSGLRRVVEYDIQLEMEACLKHSPPPLHADAYCEWKVCTQFRAPCGCPLGRMESFLPLTYSLSQTARSIPIPNLRDSAAMFESDDDSGIKSKLCDVSAPTRQDLGESPLICDVSELLHFSALHAVNMRLHISLCLDLYRPPIEEAPDSDEIVPETPEFFLMEEFIAETPESSVGHLVTATEVKAADTD
ncbi:hypothetical protein C2S52_000902 [Perilla frutescens var. hirtella]|nr:hypothetical protein C2S52_000902 [Perilla frutescens var. hirtella]